MAFTGNIPNISFTDGIGAATCSCYGPRFDNWQPSVLDYGTQPQSLGTGITYKTIFRTDYTATFDISYLRPKDLPVALRLKQWLEKGNSVTVQTFDVNSAVYSAVIDGTKLPKFKYNAQQMRYTLSLSLLNTAAAQMVCQYSLV